MSIPRRRTLRRSVLAVVIAAALTACGSSPQPAAEPGPTPDPPKVFTLDELQAALPAVTDVPTGTKEVASCPGTESCADDDVSVSIELQPPSSADQAELDQNKAVFKDQIFVTASLAEDETVAVAKLEQFRDDNQKYEGDFDISPVQKGKSYTFGEKGSGTLADTDVGGWTGATTTRLSNLYDPDDQGPDGTYEQLITSRTAVISGRTVLDVTVSLKAKYRDQAAAKAIVEQVAREYIARLG